MTKPKGIFKKRRNVCKKKVTVVVSPVTSGSSGVGQVGSTRPNLVEHSPSPKPMSSSKNKLSNLDSSYKEFLTGNSSCYDLIDLEELSKRLLSIACCKYCGNDLEFFVDRRIGLATIFRFSCRGCVLNETISNSKMCNPTSLDVLSNVYEVNVRLVYALRAIGKGLGFAPIFCGLMNLPKPPTRSDKYLSILLPAVKTVASKIMSEAVSEAVKENDGCKDLAVALDGTWQRRGHVSLNGAVTLTSVDTGKVLDVSVLSKHCLCNDRLLNKHEDSCRANYKGTSGGMELVGATEIFRRSVSQYGVRYKFYLGDGDSKAYDAVVKDKPYGEDFTIVKRECVGHVQKRMGTRLRTLKMKSNKKKLSDGKKLGGKNRLTNDRIVLIQKYYGLAIRRNKGNLNDMRKAVWATFFHLGSTNENPNHIICPAGENSWCKYQRALHKNETYDHNMHFHMPLAVMEEIRPIFKDLSHPVLLRKCLHGKSQNPNESVNNIIWSRVPKNIFVGLKSLNFGVFDAVSCFNKGNLTRCLVLKELGISVGTNCASVMLEGDKLRVVKAEKAAAAISKEARQKKSVAKRKLEEDFVAAEGPDEPSYSSGCY